ncbi:hypothetical protein B0H66DRAFT_538592 [Apodospora peruviana]|uniref:Uncharacterized protein n=1 Tax=Apodospora peruviana TaxID=516989 RepID=A0AAE0HSX9_9PEZI|nr:hypothetical protein B0H66DRAFT_538592 [Apodospora peruviana]
MDVEGLDNTCATSGFQVAEHAIESINKGIEKENLLRHLCFQGANGHFLQTCSRLLSAEATPDGLQLGRSIRRRGQPADGYQHVAPLPVHGLNPDAEKWIDHINLKINNTAKTRVLNQVVVATRFSPDFLGRYLDRVWEGKLDHPRIPLIDNASDQERVQERVLDQTADSLRNGGPSGPPPQAPPPAPAQAPAPGPVGYGKYGSAPQAYGQPERDNYNRPRGGGGAVVSRRLQPIHTLWDRLIAQLQDIMGKEFPVNQAEHPNMGQFSFPATTPDNHGGYCQPSVEDEPETGNNNRGNANKSAPSNSRLLPVSKKPASMRLK